MKTKLSPQSIFEKMLKIKTEKRLSPEEFTIVDQEIKEIIKVIDTASIILGRDFWMVKENDNFKTTTGEESQFDYYLADPEIHKKWNRANTLIQVNIRYVQELKLGLEKLFGLDADRLYQVRGVVNKENVEEWLANVKAFNRKALNHLLKFKKVDAMKCKHLKTKAYPQKVRCLNCGEYIHQ